jgi:hypothetical protein
MPYTMEDFLHEYVKTHLKLLTVEELREALLTLSPAQLQVVEEALREERETDGHSPGKEEITSGHRRHSTE